MKYYILDPDDGKIVGTATKVGDKYKWDVESSVGQAATLDSMFKAVYSDAIRKLMGGKPYIYIQMTDLMQELF